MSENLIDLIVEDIIRLKEQDRYTIDDLENFEKNFKTDLMKKYIHGLHESEPEAQLRATLLNRETPLFKWIFGEVILTETHGAVARARSVDNVAEFLGYGRIGIEIKPFFQATLNKRTHSISFKKIDLEKRSNEKAVMKQIKKYLFSSNIAKEYVVLTNIDSFYIYSKSSVINQKEDECFPFLKVSLEDFLANFRKIGSLPEYINRVEESQPKLPLDKIFLKDLAIWAKKITALKFSNNISENKKFEFAVNLINRFVFIQTLDLYWVIERDSLNTKWQNQIVYAKKKKNIKKFLIRFLTDIFEFFWDFYDTELFEIGEQGQHGVIQFLQTLDQNIENLYNFFQALRYLIGIEGNFLKRGVLQYNLKDLDSDILGNAYETFLARRKKRGIYYTPTYISQFIVSNTIDLKFKQEIKEFEVSLKSSDFAKAKKVLEDIYSIRVLDPACGSGSFLIIATNVITRNYKDIFKILKDKFKNAKSSKQPSLTKFTSNSTSQSDLGYLKNQYNSLSNNKRTAMLIVLRHIFGNDFDSNAILVTKLSLLINIIKESPSSYKPENLESNKILPYLKFNFSVSNFLVHISKVKISTFLQKNHIELLKEMTTQYERFLQQPNNTEIVFTLKSLKSELLDSIIAKFGVKNLYIDNEKIPFNSFFSQWFLYFNSDGTMKEEAKSGFDVILGNPPYISLRNLEKDYYGFILPFLERFEVHTGYNDEFYYFIEQAIKHLKIRGTLGFITSNYFFQNTYAHKLRKFINEKVSIKTILDFKEFRVFPEQGINTCILLLEKVN